MSGTEHNRDIGATYYSESKKVHVPLPQLNDFHLVAAYKKLRKEVEKETSGQGIYALDTLLHLARELGYRDLNPAAGKGGREPNDPRNAPQEPPVDFILEEGSLEQPYRSDEEHDLVMPQDETASFADDEEER